jgi:hypothetical protein
MSISNLSTPITKLSTELLLKTFAFEPIVYLSITLVGVSPKLPKTVKNIFCK